MTTAVVQRMNVFPLEIPLRLEVAHAALRRNLSDSVVVVIELTNGTLGYGETLPRPYVTHEDVTSVVDAIREVFAPLLGDFSPDSFPVALEAIEALPWRDRSDRLVPAARAAVELALLDAAMRTFNRGVDHIVQWMGLPGFGLPGSSRRVRFSGVLAAGGTNQTMRRLRLMYWAGLRDFKLKVGMVGDQERLERVVAYLERAIARGKATLRLDANGAWSRDTAGEWLRNAAHHPVASLEQPLPRGEEERLAALCEVVGWPVMHDESLVTVEDAKRLIDLGVADGFNIRVSKCGGLLPSLRLAGLARRAGVRIQLGCMVGETSILSAAGLRFLQACPGVEWAEGCFGKFLLQSDVTAKSLRFGYGGRPPRLRGPGWGVRVDPERLNRFCQGHPIVINP